MAVASSTPLTLGGQQASGLGGSMPCDRRVGQACTPETSPPMAMPCPGLRGASREVLPLVPPCTNLEEVAPGGGMGEGSEEGAGLQLQQRQGAWGRPVRQGPRRRVSRGRMGPGLEARAVGKRPICHAPPGRILSCKGSDVPRPRAEKPPLPRSVTSPLVSRSHARILSLAQLQISREGEERRGGNQGKEREKRGRGRGGGEQRKGRGTGRHMDKGQA